VLRATEYVTPALEVLDAHIEMEGRTITDTISDNAALGAMVLGGKPVKPDDVDLHWLGGALYRNQEIIETGMSAGILGHPANGVHWLANRLAGHDDYLEAGEIILAGSFTRYMWVYEGDTVYADFGPLGSISVQFEYTPDDDQGDFTCPSPRAHHSKPSSPTTQKQPAAVPPPACSCPPVTPASPKLLQVPAWTTCSSTPSTPH